MFSDIQQIKMLQFIFKSRSFLTFKSRVLREKRYNAACDLIELKHSFKRSTGGKINKTVWVHVGSGHAGSTTLQKEIFPKIPGAYFIEFSDKNIGLNKAISNLLNGSSLCFDQKRVFQELSSSLHKSKKNIISSESFLSATNVQYNHMSQDHALLSDRLVKLIPNSRIFIVVRDQVECLESSFYHHKNYLASSHGIKLGSVDEWLFHMLEHAEKKTELDDYFFYDIYSCYASNFGHENVFVCKLGDDESFVECVKHWLNDSKFALSMETVKRQNVSKKKEKFSEASVRLIRKLYAHDNRKLKDNLGIHLSDLNENG